MAIKTRTGAQRYNARMERIFENARRNKMEAAFPVMLEALKQFVSYAQNGKHPKWATYLNTIAGEKMLNAISLAQAV